MRKSRILQKKRQPHNPIDFQKTLCDMAHSMAALKRPERLLKMITRYIDRQLGLAHTSIAIRAGDTKHFTFLDSKGVRRLPVNLIRFEMNHPFVLWFQKTRHYLYRPSLNVIKRRVRKGDKAHFSLESRVARAMDDLKVELVIPGYYKKKLLGMFFLGKKKSHRHFTDSEIAFFQVLIQDCSMAVKHAEYQKDLIGKNRKLEKQVEEIKALRKKEQNTFYEILKSLAQEVYAKDAYTFGHVKQVERLGVMTAREMKMDLSGRNKDILCAGLILHDVGKIGIPDHILNKPSSLDPEEWEIMKTHVDKGASILEHLTDFKEVAEIVWCHHENYDGSGYPRGVAAKDIPIQSRIVSAVDAFHAIVSTRCYSKGRPVRFAFEELRRCAGTQFDPDVVEALVCAVQKDMKKRGLNAFGDDGQAAEESPEYKESLVEM